MESEPDYLIIGQGLSGSLCSLELLRRGKTVRVIDAHDPASASRLAAGLMSPVTGQRTALLWRAHELFEQARASYAQFEARFQKPFYFPLPLIRAYTSEDQRRLFRARAEDPSFKGWLGAELDEAELNAKGLSAPLGGRLILGGGWLDAQALLEAWRGELKKMGVLEERSATPEDFSSSRVILCTGVKEASQRHFPALKFQPTKGELIEIEEPHADASSINYGSHFAIPLGKGRWRLGATYDRQDLTPEPTPQALETLTQGAASLFKLRPKILSHKAGIRPNLLGHFPVIGSLPERPDIFILNGLGSKGVIWAPMCAKLLVDHMEEGKAIPKELDVNRFS